MPIISLLRLLHAGHSFGSIEVVGSGTMEGRVAITDQVASLVDPHDLPVYTYERHYRQSGIHSA
jgi:hypothetical protein